ncbi:hypothetical protein [Novosphingobium sp. 9U]|uniref:hypothetical protein n=1 Tax=Novosphingobium sp. 9U TaxID=2653158 RepID=UPI0012F414CD|nr:hypothetical protein [Novosphingobium sp. 9U]VWX47217.1 conserved hypothetical protein [Novosphingobium sp. 9U]
MQPHTRAIIAATAFAVIAGKKVAGVYDHATARNLEIAAEAQGGKVQGFDGERGVAFGGTLPEIHDAGDKAWISFETAGAQAKGYDRGSSSFYTAQVSDSVVQLYDHEHAAWFAYDFQDAAAPSSFLRS